MQRRQLLLCSTALATAGAHAQAPEPRLWFVFLESGKPTPPDTDAVQAMQRGHIANFQRLSGLGILLAAGPLRDPARLQRGIVVLRAPGREALPALFEPDAYVREGHMTLNAQPAVAHAALRTEGIDPTGVVEGRILKLSRPARPLPDDQAQAGDQLLRSLLASGTVGAWYTLSAGPTAELLFSRSTDDEGLRAALAAHPGLASGAVALTVWPQWLSRGVVP